MCECTVAASHKGFSDVCVCVFDFFIWCNYCHLQPGILQSLILETGALKSHLVHLSSYSLRQITKTQPWVVCDHRQLIVLPGLVLGNQSLFRGEETLSVSGLLPWERGLLQAGMHFSEKRLFSLITFENGRKYEQSLQILVCRNRISILFGAGPTKDKRACSFGGTCTLSQLLHIVSSSRIRPFTLK